MKKLIILPRLFDFLEVSKRSDEKIIIQLYYHVVLKEVNLAYSKETCS